MSKKSPAAAPATKRKAAARKASKKKASRSAPSAINTTQATGAIAGISDDKVEQSTGKSWAQWLAILDKAGAATMPHKEIAAWLIGNHPIGGWWAQMVTVGYEQARGLREKHQKTDGFSASVSRTLEAPVAEVFRAWADETLRKAWLSEPGLEFRGATVNKSVRARWDDGSTVVVNFYPASGDRCRVTVQQDKMKKAGDVANAKEFWAEALDRLRER